MTTIWCVFRNYAAHAVEIGGDVTTRPLFFTKPARSIVQAGGDGTASFLLPNGDDHIDHEVEMVVRLGDNLKPSEVCVGIDVTNRTRQTEAKQKGWPWTEGKSFRDSAVLGTWAPWEAREYMLTLMVNGTVRQRASTELMIHDLDTQLASIDNWYGLKSGDLVFTGTPKGVGEIEAGDLVEASLMSSSSKLVSRLHATARLENGTD